jgi:tetratricopeptide (TPR) repeat protein
MEQNENQEFDKVEEVVTATKSHHSSKTNSFNIQDFFTKNRKRIITGTGILAGLVILLVGYKKFYAAPLEEEAENAIFKAELYASMDSVNLALKGDGQYKGLIELVDEYGSTRAGKRASYLLGMIYLRQGKYDDAIENLENFDLGDKVVQSLAIGAIGDCYVEKKELDKAAGYYEKAAEISQLDFPGARFYKKAGLVYENLNQYDRAASAYETIQKEFPKSQEASDIEKYIFRAKTKLEK